MTSGILAPSVLQSEQLQLLVQLSELHTAFHLAEHVWVRSTLLLCRAAFPHAASRAFQVFWDCSL